MKLFLPIILLGLVISSPALADAETDALRAQIKALEARLDQLEKKQKQQVAAPAPKVENRLAIVERKQEVAEDAAKAQAEKTPAIEVGNGKGLSITSPDKQYSLKLRAYVQADGRTFFDNSNTSNVDNFLIRSARPILEAKMTDYFSGRMMLDFGNGTTRLLDAYADVKPVPSSKLFTLRAGKMKAPLGLERWQSEQEILFVERGQATNLVPFRDIGIMAYGEIIPDQLEYQLAVTNGAADLADNTTDTDNHKDVNARLFAQPFRWSDITFLRGLGLGVAGSYGKHNGSTGSPQLVDGYRTMGQGRFFAYRSSAGQVVYADGKNWRVNPQAYYYNGPFSLLGEYVLDSQRVTRQSSSSATLKNDAWTAIATYVVTGEDASFDGVKPANNFAPEKGQWGAFEILARLGGLTVDSDAFTNFADSTTSARNAKEATLGATWYLNNSVKLNVDYSLTKFDGGATSGDREDEKVLMTRMQVRF